MNTAHVRGLGTVAIAALVSALAVGCTGDDDDVPRHPQIFPHINPVNFCQVEMPAPNTTCVLGDPAHDCTIGQCSCATDPCTCIPRKVTFDLMLFNRGRERLDISSYDVIGDRNCAFVPPGGGLQLYDNDESDDFAATARNREAAFMRIQYSPPGVGDDEAIIKIHSNAENFPEPDGLDIYVCAGGTYETLINCRIRLDPDCHDSDANAYSCDPLAEADSPDLCPSFCSASGIECTPPTPEDPMADSCPEGEFCESPYYCVPDEDQPTRGSCYCRPCAVPPNEGWDDCPDE